MIDDFQLLFCDIDIFNLCNTFAWNQWHPLGVVACATLRQVMWIEKWLHNRNRSYGLTLLVAFVGSIVQ